MVGLKAHLSKSLLKRNKGYKKPKQRAWEGEFIASASS